MITKKIYSNKK